MVKGGISMTCTEESKEHIEYTFHAFCKVVIRSAYGNSPAAQNSGESRSPSAGRKSGAPIFYGRPRGYSSVPAPFSFSHPSTAGSLISSTLRHSFVPPTFATALRCFRRKRLS